MGASNKKVRKHRLHSNRCDRSSHCASARCTDRCILSACARAESIQSSYMPSRTPLREGLYTSSSALNVARTSSVMAWSSPHATCSATEQKKHARNKTKIQMQIQNINTCDTGQTRNKLLEQWVHLTNHTAGHWSSAGCERCSPLAVQTDTTLLRYVVID